MTYLPTSPATLLELRGGTFALSLTIPIEVIPIDARAQDRRWRRRKRPVRISRFSREILSGYDWYVMSLYGGANRRPPRVRAMHAEYGRRRR